MIKEEGLVTVDLSFTITVDGNIETAVKDAEKVLVSQLRRALQAVGDQPLTVTFRSKSVGARGAEGIPDIVDHDIQQENLRKAIVLITGRARVKEVNMRQLSSLLNVSPAQISRMANGHVQMTGKIQRRIIEALPGLTFLGEGDRNALRELLK